MGTPRRDRTADEVECELAVRRLPGDGSTWLELVERHARQAGALLADVCTPHRRTTTTVRARHGAWLELRSVGYSLEEIGAPWGIDHTSVCTAVRLTPPTLYGLPAEAYQALRGFGPMCDGLERAEHWLTEGFCTGENEAHAALGILEALEELLAEAGPRGDGARFALASIGAGKLEELKAQAMEIIGGAAWERAEASAITSGLLEEVEAG